MNVITIRNFDEFNTIIASPILLTGKDTLEQEELYENMWAIWLTEKLLQKVTKSILLKFIDDLIIKKQEQAFRLGYAATFYMWHDIQTGQLRFNLLSGNRLRLPFGCTVELQASAEPIIDEFINESNNGLIPWDELEILDPKTTYPEDDENEMLYTLKVFSLFF